MKIPPSDSHPSPIRELDASESAEPILTALVQQRDAFQADVSRIEATIAQGVEDGSRLYERLLRYRRISEKLENRIQVARIQHRMRTGAQRTAG